MGKISPAHDRQQTMEYEQFHATGWPTTTRLQSFVVKELNLDTYMATIEATFADKDPQDGCMINVSYKIMTVSMDRINRGIYNGVIERFTIRKPGWC